MDKILSFIKSLFTGEIPDPEEIKTIITERIAIDQNGIVGSLYELTTDTIKGKSRDSLKSNTITQKTPIICELYNSRTGETQNLLTMIGIDQPLRISIISKMIQPAGVASIITYSLRIDRYTRFLYFHFRNSHGIM